MTEYSITIRPHKTTFIEIEKKKINFFPLFLKGVEKHIISYEKGKDDTYNHFQCYIKYEKERRQDKIKESILRNLFKIGIELDPEEKLYGIKVKLIKTNIEGVIGYTLKEGGKCITNLTNEEIEKYKKIYLDHKTTNENDKKNFFKTNQKNYHIHIKNFIKENEIFYCEKYDTNDIKDIIGEMINRGYYMNFINSRNIIEKILYVKSYLNKEGINYIEYCYDKCEKLEQL